MKNIFSAGDSKTYIKEVTESDFARFESGVVHEVCSTFALAQAMEWAGRLFVLDMKEPDEEGIGTMLHIDHMGPAYLGETLLVEAIVKEQKGHELICDISVKARERWVAKGQTGQKILKTEKLTRLLKNSRGL